MGSVGDACGEAACCITGVAADVGAATCGVQGRPRLCPVGYGCRRLTSAVCWEYAWKFVGG